MIIIGFIPFVANNLMSVIRPQFSHLSYAAAGSRNFTRAAAFINRWQHCKRSRRNTVVCNTSYV